jgi:hypothetical protein
LSRPKEVINLLVRNYNQDNSPQNKPRMQTMFEATQNINPLISTCSAPTMILAEIIFNNFEGI